MRTKTSDEELPRAVLDGEIQQILRLGIELRSNNPIEDRAALDNLCSSYDVVLLACGAGGSNA